jgi:hypothetical protein
MHLTNFAYADATNFGNKQRTPLQRAVLLQII